MTGRTTALAFGLLVAGAGCARSPVTLVAATCGEPRSHATESVARACGGRPDCIVVPRQTITGDGVACGAEFAVEWRCAGDEGLRHAFLAADAVQAGQTLRLSCDGPAPARIEILDVVGPDTSPSTGVTDAIIDACAGLESCEPRLDADGPARAGLGPTSLRIQWRCEGSMQLRSTPFDSGGRARLSCR